MNFKKEKYISASLLVVRIWKKYSPMRLDITEIASEPSRGDLIKQRSATKYSQVEQAARVRAFSYSSLLPYNPGHGAHICSLVLYKRTVRFKIGFS